MKNEAIRDYFVMNGEIIENRGINVFKNINKPPIYEVIRVIKGVPLFLEEHLERMRKSSDIVDYQIYRTDKEIEEDIKKLIKENNVENLNIKLLCTEIQGKGQVFLAYFIKSYYPESRVYMEGIHTILYHFERENPNAKILNVSFKEDVNRKIEENNAFEALLVNNQGYITEGSRSNMFFVKDEILYTAPKGDVLLGVTRNHIMEVCNKLGLKVVEENIHIEDLSKINASFMTGTSVNVLPISSIDKRKYDSVNNIIVKSVGDAYLKDMKKYLDLNKKIWI
ncbi:aminotransferase class IV [Sporanaerobacter acetigenes]|uniref:Branched-chain amino acid aminotransferase n=1 Tax=Sporanaerobacter acetigenes DSM 13106 TaxID=1123281 RepID=A0A1M5X785_9FIRM|nr:aminotransferase class IV [Sporanaerobacter acetigenes]SHH95697.1 branched-chain amino acid aminotransferase [Sporanaerobacter acetigenes DSM 13106]